MALVLRAVHASGNVVECDVKKLPSRSQERVKVRNGWGRASLRWLDGRVAILNDLLRQLPMFIEVQSQVKVCGKGGQNEYTVTASALIV